MRLQELVRRCGESFAARLAMVESRLRLLSPASVLERGYSVTLDAHSGKVIRSSADVKSGQRLRTRLKTGEVHSVVEEGD